jgi:hypothetical protein
MLCPTCGVANRPAANYCRACGRQLSVGLARPSAHEVATIAIREELRNYWAPGGSFSTTTREQQVRIGDLLFLGRPDETRYALRVRAITDQSVELESVGDGLARVLPDERLDIPSGVLTVHVWRHQTAKLATPTPDAMTIWELQDISG